MADDELATKAPESDAAEDNTPSSSSKPEASKSAVPDDSKVEQGSATLGVCSTASPIHQQMHKVLRHD